MTLWVSFCRGGACAELRVAALNPACSPLFWALGHGATACFLFASSPEAKLTLLRGFWTVLHFRHLLSASCSDTTAQVVWDASEEATLPRGDFPGPTLSPSLLRIPLTSESHWQVSECLNTVVHWHFGPCLAKAKGFGYCSNCSFCPWGLARTPVGPFGRGWPCVIWFPTRTWTWFSTQAISQLTFFQSFYSSLA